MCATVTADAAGLHRHAQEARRAAGGGVANVKACDQARARFKRAVTSGVKAQDAVEKAKVAMEAALKHHQLMLDSRQLPKVTVPLFTASLASSLQVLRGILVGGTVLERRTSSPTWEMSATRPNLGGVEDALEEPKTTACGTCSHQARSTSRSQYL